MRIRPPPDDDKQRARYGRAARMRAELTPHHLPHTIIMDMLRERASREEVVSRCPMWHRIGLRYGDFTDDGSPIDFRTGDCAGGYLMWYWAIDEVRYDHYHECFVARYKDRPPAYMSPELAVWAIISWSEWGGRGYLSDVHYAEWLAWHRCRPWQDVVARLESHGEVAAGAAAHVDERLDVFEAPEPPCGGEAYSRILMWPHARSNSHAVSLFSQEAYGRILMWPHAPAAMPRLYAAGHHVGDRDGPWPPAAAVDHCMALSSSCPPTDPRTRGRRKADIPASIAGEVERMKAEAGRTGRKADIPASIAGVMRRACSALTQRQARLAAAWRASGQYASVKSAWRMKADGRRHE